MSEKLTSARSMRRPAHAGGSGLVHRDEAGRVRYHYRPGQILVATDDVPRIADALQAEGAERVRAIHGMVVFRIPGDDAVPEVIARLRELDAAPVVSPNCVLQAALHDIWGSAHPAEPAEPLPPLPEGPALAGTGVKVGIVDTGLAAHEWFQGRARRARDGVVDDDRLDEKGDKILDYEAGHGTAVAGIVLQHAPGAEVVVWSARVEEGRIEDGAANEAIVGLVRDHGVDILNLSFGAIEQHNIDHKPMELALEEARRLNPDLVVVAAAGNRHVDHVHVGEDGDHDSRQVGAGPADAPSFPAAFEEVIAVGAVNDRRLVPNFSLTGDWVTCYAPGTLAHTTFIHWSGLRALAPKEPGITPSTDEPVFEGFARGSGTSFAAPRVTGAIAAAMSPRGERTRNPRAAVNHVVRSAGPDRIVDPPNFVTG